MQIIFEKLDMDDMLKNSHLFVDADILGIYKTNTNCSVLVTLEHGLYHLSISHEKRDPSWEEIREARYTLTPNECRMAMILPPRENYINIHNFCFHLFELIDKEIPNGV